MSFRWTMSPWTILRSSVRLLSRSLLELPPTGPRATGESQYPRACSSLAFRPGVFLKRPKSSQALPLGSVARGSRRAPARRLITASRTFLSFSRRQVRAAWCPSRPPFRVDVAFEASSLARRASAQSVSLALDSLRDYQSRRHPPRCFSHPRGVSVPPMRSFFRPLPLMGFLRFASRVLTVAACSLRQTRHSVAYTVYFNSASALSAVRRRRFTEHN